MGLLDGVTLGSLADVGTATKALHTQTRPGEVGAFGAYGIGAFSQRAVAGFPAATPVYACRWGDATRVCRVQRVAISVENNLTAFVVGVTLFDLIVARNYTVSDSGGTVLVPTAVNNDIKRRTSFSTSRMTDLRISSNAGLTAGTRTLDSHPVNFVRGAVPATSVNYSMVGRQCVSLPGASTVASTQDWVDLFNAKDPTAWPLTFVQNEGFIIRATVPATGQWFLFVLFEWLEFTNLQGYN